MTRRSRIRKRERQRKKVEQQKLQKLALQLPALRKISTAELSAEIERRSLALADIFEGRS